MTGTDIAPRDDEINLPESVAIDPLLAWAERAHRAHQIAKSLAKTSFVPSTMKGNADEITGCILAGDELGLKPMASLRSVDIIAGTPALRAHAMRGLVQSRGHEVELLESTETLCRMRGRRKGATEWQEVVWPLERARRMGLVDKAEWKKQPQTMLIARATGEICRLIASDVLYAMPYATEELDRDSPPPPLPQRKVTRAEIEGKPDEPEATTEQPDEEWPETAKPGGGSP